MGTSGAYGGSGGAWSGGSGTAEDFAGAPSDYAAQELVDQALQALQSEQDQSDQAEAADGDDQPLAPALVESRLPGLRVRPPGGGGDGPGGAGGGGGGGGRGRTGGGGRSRGRTATAGGQAIAAGYAVRAGDGATLAALGLSLADLAGLDVYDQIERILDATVPASGLPQESEMRRAATRALILLLRDGDDSPRAVIEAFVREYVYETVMTEYGERLRNGDPDGGNAAEIERRLKGAIRAYTAQVTLPDDAVTADDFRTAIGSVLRQVEELVA